MVVTADEAEARRLLDAELATHGLRGWSAVPYTLREVRADVPVAVVLQNGDY